MAARMREEIKVGPLAIRFLVDGEESGDRARCLSSTFRPA